MKLLTIVIPSYNTEAFIEKNMKTFLDERLYDKAEVLIINDGSRDRTAEMAAEFAESYPGYIRLINKENGGHGSVINRGIKEAQGKYFKVVDADDWVNTENLVRLLADLGKTDADAVINPYIMIDQSTGKEKKIEYAIHDQQQAVISVKDVLRRQMTLTLHAVTYKTSILRDKNIKVTEHCFYEDYQYDLYPVPYLKTVFVLDYPVYWYLVGQKTQSVDAANALKNVDMCYKVYCDMVSHYERNKGQYNKDLDLYMQNKITVFLRSLYHIFLRNGYSGNVFEKYVEITDRIKADTESFYTRVAEQNFYIKLLQTKNRTIFKILSVMMKIYKSK